MNFTLNSLPDLVKAKVDQCSSTKRLWKKPHVLYSKKHIGQDENDDDDFD